MVLVDRPPPHVYISEKQGERVSGPLQISRSEIKTGTSGPTRRREANGRQNRVVKGCYHSTLCLHSLCVQVSGHDLALGGSNFPWELISIRPSWKAAFPVICNSWGEMERLIRYIIDSRFIPACITHTGRCKMGCLFSAGCASSQAPAEAEQQRINDTRCVFTPGSVRIRCVI